MTAFKPTGEQEQIRDRYLGGGPLAVTAGAGTGKTSTLVLLGEARPARVRYVAFNKSTALEAERRFPKWVRPSTAHSLAWQAVKGRFRDRMDNQRHMPAREVARLLKVSGDPLKLSERMLAPHQVARLAMETVKHFCYSAAEEPSWLHVPHLKGVDSPADKAVLRDALVPLARRAWDDLCRPVGQLRYQHDYYLKWWQLSGAVIDADVLFVDEAQDLNPVLEVIVAAQDAQVIAVGDTSQQLYSWRGAVDALDRLGGGNKLALSQSFRFGPAIAREANKWLSLLAADLRLSGTPSVPSRLGEAAAPRAILARSNAGVMKQVIEQVSAGRKVAMPSPRPGVPGGAEIEKLAKAAISLKQGRGTDHPELMAFQTWAELQDYCLAPGTRLLTADLRWQPIELIESGDTLVAFDEEQLPGNLGRRFRTATVESTKTITRPCVRITTDDGVSVIASSEHRWLVKSGNSLRWVRSNMLSLGTRIVSVGRWEQEDTREAGWLAGMFDGEGWVGGGYETSRATHLGMAQKEGPVAENARRLLKERGFEFGDYAHGNDVRQLTIKGGISEYLRFLGTMRPERLVAKAGRLWEDRRVERVKFPRVVALEVVPAQEVIALQTDCKTFIAEGLLSHNCQNDPGGEDLAVLVNLIDEHTPEKILSLTARLVEERYAEVVVSTVHKAKGREWESVLITDFRKPKRDPETDQVPLPARDQMMAAYVAVTRAKVLLDRGPLSFVDEYLTAGAAA